MFICQVLFKKERAWLLASFNMWLLFAVPLSEGGGLCHMSFLSERDHGTTCMLCFCFTSPDPPSDSFNYRYTFSYVWSFSIFLSNSKTCSSISELTYCFMPTGWANANRFIATAGSPISDLASFITSFLHTWNWSHSCRVVISVISM